MESAGASTPPQAEQFELLFTAAEYDAHRGMLERLFEMRDYDIPHLLPELSDLIARRNPGAIDHEYSTEECAQHLELVGELIAGLEAMLPNATVIADTAAPVVVAVGRAADVEDLDSGRVLTYRITCELPAGPRSLSLGSPVARALIGRAAGDVVAVDLPGGHVERLRVVAVRLGAPPEEFWYRTDVEPPPFADPDFDGWAEESDLN